MSKRILCAAFLLAVVASTAFAASSFQNTCSGITFAYVNNQAALQAVCLRADGSSNPSTLILQGIGNQNGTLVQGTGASTFQKSCGDIQITAKDSSQVVLSALCRTSGGSSHATSLQLNGIGNNNGSLTQ
ncbi:MAG: hypothetical protein QOJ16_4938 [Acidobacteriota bacterium]|jgi:opacity protein-like surface antigen|nr:hypothetical protein [Acidobacteriota bacterium]